MDARRAAGAAALVPAAIAIGQALVGIGIAVQGEAQHLTAQSTIHRLRRRRQLP